MASLGLAYLDSDLDSDPEIVPESPPAMPSTESLSPAILSTESLPAMPSLPTISMPLPPLDQLYNSSDEGIAAINLFARPYGYAVTTRRSKSRRGVKKTVYLGCDRSGTIKEHTEESYIPKKRQTTTYANDCPFAITLRLDHQTNIWRLTIENPSHNHEPSPPSTHAAQRALELTYKKDKIENALRQGRITRQILTEIREADPKSTLIARDIYNTRRRLNQIFLAGRTPLQALLQELPKDGDWIFKYELDDQNHMSTLFCIHRSGVKMLQTNPWVISMDCTYKTNQYGLPLLNIVGFSSTGSTFHLGFAFMRDEKEGTYEVMLSCLAETYKSLGLDTPNTILTDKEQALINAIETIFPSTKNMICI